MKKVFICLECGTLYAFTKDNVLYTIKGEFATDVHEIFDITYGECEECDEKCQNMD